ncbi:unnamed protein product [Didymodactylos carnosus]|uniref:Mab-21-like nucleotidyltransferase domain-containing protein n=1 Tax=Didymodactylos carnosus TaxID=1234261 RepID=A0A8S2JIJ1_9BILA|nr:unnamed protein product [Didymodactylos carnosus]CAF3812643.1 unnamed protein product [Didymodactylos carnosus]
MGLLFTKTRSKDRPVRLHLAGSMGDGQFTARLIADNIEVEYDIMYLSKVEIKNESHLEYVPDATGFVRILRNRDRDLRHLPHNGTFINGCQLKEDIHSIIKANQVRSLETSSTSIDQASIFLQYNDLWPPVDREIIRKLQTMRQELTNERRRNAQRNIEQYFLFAKSLINFQFKDDFGNISKRLFNINLSNEYLDKQREKANHIIEIYQILYMSLIGISIPSELTNKIRLLVNFYNKYRHMVNEDIFQQRYSQVRQRITMTEDCDVVVALKLSFWPSVARKRLRYWKQYKPIIYRKVRKSTVYVIPKWSKMTAEDDGSYEFRLSFSNAEEILAKSRSKSEKMLNDIARTIYYKHLRKPVTFSHDCVHSYFIKTVVLWMCEEFDLQNNYRDIIDEKQIEVAQ